MEAKNLAKMITEEKENKWSFTLEEVEQANPPCSGPASASVSDGEQLPAEGQGDANTCATCTCGANFRITKNGVCLDCKKKIAYDKLEKRG